MSVPSATILGMDAIFPHQADLDRLRTDQSGTCWWCGDVADSHEHKHKASVLRKMWGDEGLYLGRSGHELWSIPSTNSNAVKFGKIMCRECNNVRSQPFDKAYDTFVAYVWANSRELGRSRRLDWVAVYGEHWQDGARDLGKYVIKLFGCWLADNEFAPPLGLMQV